MTTTSKITYDFLAELGGEKYQVERFTDAHMLCLLEMFTSKMADIQAQSKAGSVIKEIMIPNIPDDVISVNRNGLYIIHLDIQTLNYLVLQLIKNYHLYELQDIQNGVKSKTLLVETQEKITAAQNAIDVMGAQQKLEKTINLSVFTPEETAEAKNTRISELQEQLKKLQQEK